MENTKEYNLEERTLSFARNTREFIKTVKQNIYNSEYAKQLVRSSGSVGANYIEANEAFINESIELTKIFSSIIKKLV